MIRPVDVVVAALRLVCPNQPEHTLQDWGAEVQHLAAENGHDPITQAVIVENESRCDPSAVNKRDGLEVVGLMQINLGNFSVCRNMGKLDTSSLACERVRAQLLDPKFNLRMGSQAINMNRIFCREKTGHAMFENWLASYGGFNVPEKNIYCARQLVGRRWVKAHVPEVTRRVMARRRWVLRKLGLR